MACPVGLVGFRLTFTGQAYLGNCKNDSSWLNSYTFLRDHHSLARGMMVLMQPKGTQHAYIFAANLSKITLPVSWKVFVSPCHSEDWSFSPRLNKTFDVGALTGEFLFPILGETRILRLVGPTFGATHVSSKNVHNFRLTTCLLSWYLMAISKIWYPRVGTEVEISVGIVRERSCWSCYVLAVFPDREFDQR